MAQIELYPFKYFCPLKGRWVTARYKAHREEIAARYARWEITGPPEIRGERGGDPFALTAGHLASSPSASESIPIDLRVGTAIERNDRRGE